MSTRTTTLVATLAAVLLLPTLLSACSEKPDASPSASSKAAGSDFASCMRDKGYDIDDPTSKGITLKQPEGVDAEQYQKDLTDCTGAGAGEGFSAAKPVPGSEEKYREVGACVREGGFEDFPDDEAAQATYTPSGDEDTFTDLSKQCFDEAFGDSGFSKSTGGGGE